MSEWNIDRDKCLRCGACISACPTQALNLAENGIEWDEEKCTYCENCELICPVGAITVDGDN